MKFVVYKDSGGNWRWRLVASNGQTVASSGESFSSRATPGGPPRTSRPAPPAPTSSSRTNGAAGEGRCAPLRRAKPLPGAASRSS